MTLRDFPLLADENLFASLVGYLRSEGFDVRYVQEEGWNGFTDTELLALAAKEGRVVVTQDNDFGQIVFTSPTDFTGIVYLRPGHFPPDRHIETFRVILAANPAVQPPFILTAENKGEQIRIKVRGVFY